MHSGNVIKENLMYANEYKVLLAAVEEGVHSGIRKAWKHTDTPPPDDYQAEVIIDLVVMNILEWFHMNGEETRDILE